MAGVILKLDGIRRKEAVRSQSRSRRRKPKEKRRGAYRALGFVAITHSATVHHAVQLQSDKFLLTMGDYGGSMDFVVVIDY